jgi:pimeloyl-ACP methyl ester carboxylesterase
MTETLQIRIHGNSAAPTLIYLPGVHGDWTLIGQFRLKIADRVRFVEFTYPRTLTWSLDDYAAGVEAALEANGITQGWLLGESFSSQVVWQILSRKRFQVRGVILAGGFVRHPMRPAARLAGRIADGLPLKALTRVMFGYAKVARYRFRHAPETLTGIKEFVARRTPLDKAAASHRLRLIAANDPRAIARSAKAPVYALTGAVDPIVPWFWVRPWLKRHCPALREYRIIRAADHNVLGSAAALAAEQIVEWIERDEKPDVP